MKNNYIGIFYLFNVEVFTQDFDFFIEGLVFFQKIEFSAVGGGFETMTGPLPITPVVL